MPSTKARHLCESPAVAATACAGSGAFFAAVRAGRKAAGMQHYLLGKSANGFAVDAAIATYRIGEMLFPIPIPKYIR